VSITPPGAAGVSRSGMASRYTELILAATRNLHLNNATSGATFTRTVQPSREQDKSPISHIFLSRPVEDCERCSALAGVRNLGLDDPGPGCSDLHCNFGVRSSRAHVEWLHRAEPGPSSGVYRPHTHDHRGTPRSRPRSTDPIVSVHRIAHLRNRTGCIATTVRRHEEELRRLRKTQQGKPGLPPDAQTSPRLAG